MRPGELSTALRIVWLILGTATLGILISTLMLPPAAIASIVPKCESKARYHRECFCCGMTTAFLDISHGRLREASRANRGAIPLYGAFVVNDSALLVFLRRRLAARGKPAC